MTDWMPTILNLAQASGSVPNDIDGFDQTEAIFGDEPSARKMVVNEFGTNLRRPTTHQGAIQIEDGWKLLMNPVEHKGMTTRHKLKYLKTETFSFYRTS